MSAAARLVDRPPIRRLDAGLVSRIAAGEVVERPASVIKELVENAVDAGATEVHVRVRDGGLDTIEVDDDGVGIPADELPLAVERHATSKLSENGSLDAIATLGFRGEALGAIAAVSRLRVESRTPGVDEAHGISVVGGQAVGRFVKGRPPGTTVQVHDLFFNTPARRKFLRSPAAELVEIAGVVERLYLARPAIGLTLHSEGKEVARYPPTRQLGDALARVFGEEAVGRTFPVQAEVPHGHLDAVLGLPSVTRSSARGLHVVVNGRVVNSRPLAQAVRLAYVGYLPRDRFPVGVVHLSLDPSRVDVNVHPTKREVRLAGERELADALRRAVRSALGTVPQSAEPTSSRSAPSEEAVAEAGDESESSVPLTGNLGRAPSLEGATVQRRLLPEGQAEVVAATGAHPPLALLGCLFNVYWVAESEGELVLVDQHAASERVVFDALMRTGRLARQELVVPLRLPLTPRQRATLGAHEETMRSSGYEVEPFSGEEVRVRSVPSYRGHLARPEALPALLDEIADGGRATVPDGLIARRAASVACHASVRGGDRIPVEQMGRILQSLYSLPDAAYACPHGRPIVVRFPRTRVDRWFLRPGG